MSVTLNNEDFEELCSFAPPHIIRKHVRNGRKTSTAFLQLAAGDYIRLSQDSRHPGRDLARLWGVTESASSRWITEARRRGLLALAPEEAKA